MRIDPRHRGQKTGIRHTQYADPSVVGWYVLEKPGYRVVGVRALIHRAGVIRAARGALHDELALAAVPPPNVLENEDVSVSREEAVVLSDHGVARNAVRCSRKQEGQGLVRATRLTDTGVQVHAIANRDPDNSAAVVCDLLG
jgi:hypothetical protein